jgi:hypothetical protein
MYFFVQAHVKNVQMKLHALNAFRMQVSYPLYVDAMKVIILIHQYLAVFRFAQMALNKTI